ncbi:helix-turn-helix domain-containing protein [Phytohabitans rumicis]|uniref:Transcriptional regulator n=1 Tax=Phytohabitans rumicis TaxID=1076125 RepID=A0A6V8KQV8_9ACTN|nr:helix-turn-helix transcriptional regulator [Phytohabitans rumicis]GFJ87553.1 transcriptional regulator [Phytohabitans rumicis]
MVASLRSRWLGQQMRDLRDDRGLTLRYVAVQVGFEYADVKAFEHGERVLHHAQVTALLDAYGVYEQRVRDRLLSLARDAFRLSRWEDDFYAPDLDVSMLDNLWLESIAERVSCYGATLVPDLLRVSGYVEAVVHRDFGPAVVEEQVRWWVRAIRDRQERFDGEPAGLRVVVTESVLHRPVGGNGDAARLQLAHLGKAADRGQMRVLPSRAAYVSGMDASFTVFGLPQPYPRTVASTSHVHDAAVHEGQAAQSYASVFDKLWAAALPASESAALITELM